MGLTTKSHQHHHLQNETNNRAKRFYIHALYQRVINYSLVLYNICKSSTICNKVFVTKTTMNYGSIILFSCRVENVVPRHGPANFFCRAMDWLVENEKYFSASSLSESYKKFCTYSYEETLLLETFSTEGLQRGGTCLGEDSSLDGQDVKLRKDSFVHSLNARFCGFSSSPPIVEAFPQYRTYYV